MRFGKFEGAARGSAPGARRGQAPRSRFGRHAASVAFVAGLSLAAPARADEQTVKLIQLLIQKGILSPGQAKDLLRETGAGAHGRAKPAPPQAAIEEAPPATSGQIRVTYVPQFIRKQIADEVRAQVMDQAQTEGWAAPDALPEWTKRIKLFGDIRVRAEDDGFDSNNYNQFINFNSINNGGGFDFNSYAQHNVANPPFLNTTEDRERFRLRARFGLQADIDDWVQAVIRVGTGQDDGPVSPNQTLGTGTATLGAAGDFAKPELWLDQGYLKFTPLPELTVVAGRAPSQFLPSDLMFYPELQFDGFAAKGSEDFGNVTVFGTIGAFPLFDTAFDFSTNSDIKYSSTNSYLTALQAGAAWQVRPNLKATLGVGILISSARRALFRRHAWSNRAAPITAARTTRARRMSSSAIRFTQYETLFSRRSRMAVCSRTRSIMALPHASTCWTFIRVSTSPHIIRSTSRSKVSSLRTLLITTTQS